MDLASAATDLVNSIVEMPFKFAEVATHDPVSAVLLAVGAVFTGLAVGVFGYLSLGAVVSLFTFDSSQGPRREAR
jgi:hypothetical protein